MAITRTFWLGPIIVAAATGAMVAWTWMGWLDPTFDFGRELYVPWQLLNHRVLYRDLAYQNGPFSPYMNLVWFSLFGVSLRALVIGNLIIAFAVVALVYRMTLAVASHLAATVACLTFVGLFGFGQIVLNGNFNWICPYSHEMTHGIGLSLLSIWLLDLAQRRESLLRGLGSGVAMGMVFLTKSEVFLAGAVAVWSGLGLTFLMPHINRRFRQRMLLVWCGGALLCPLVAFAALSSAMPVREALLGTLGSWRYVFLEENAAQQFFLKGAGLDDPLGRMVEIVIGIGWHAALFIPAVLAALACRRPGRWRIAVAIGAFVLVAVTLFWHRQSPTWRYAALPLPFFMCVIGASAVIEFLRSRRRETEISLLTVTLAVFAGLLLLKMILYTRIHHYGFALAMPSMLVWIVVLVQQVPKMIQRWGGYGPLFVSVAGATWLAMMLAYLGFVGGHFQQKTHVVGEGSDAFNADARGAMFEDARKQIAANTNPGHSLACLPDCEILNYLTRRTNPTQFGQFNPHQVMIHGEQRMLEAFQVNLPDVIVLTHRDMSEYGFRFFGRDYATELYGWIERNYRPVAQLGAMPLRDERAGVLILVRPELLSSKDAPGDSSKDIPTAK